MGSISTSAISMARSLLLVFLGVQLFTLGSTGIWRDENAQLESAGRCIQQSGVDWTDMSNATAASTIWGQCVLCNFDGSNFNKAIRIMKRLTTSCMCQTSNRESFPTFGIFRALLLSFPLKVPVGGWSYGGLMSI